MREEMQTDQQKWEQQEADNGNVVSKPAARPAEWLDGEKELS